MTDQPPYPPPQPQGYGPGYPPPSPYGYPPPQNVGTNGLAIASLVSSLVGLICGVGPIVAVVLGFIALNQIKQSGQGGRGLALAGIIIGGLSIALFAVYLVFAIMLAASNGDHSAAAVLVNR